MISRMYRILFFVVIGVGLFASCGSETEEGTTTIASSYVSTVDLPSNTKPYTYGEAIPFLIKFSDQGKSFKNLKAYVDGKLIHEANKAGAEIKFDYKGDSLGVGNHSVKVETELADGNVETIDYEFLVLSDVTPKRYIVKVDNKFPHDKSAYTQGLVFENGKMYEGTGLQGKSELRYVDFVNNKVLRSLPLAQNYFGEGVAVVGDEIFQLTWSTRKGFVYKKTDFTLQREFSYPTEGWGLCYDGVNLILSDGTDVLYFYNPKDFSLVKKIRVADNATPMNLLNELEFIDGEIWANVYQTDMIVRIDPATGRVMSTIDCSGLLTDAELMEKVDVLNGIAFDSATKRVYLTGKWWPWLFQVSLVEQPAQ